MNCLRFVATRLPAESSDSATSQPEVHHITIIYKPQQRSHACIVLKA